LLCHNDNEVHPVPQHPWFLMPGRLTQWAAQRPAVQISQDGADGIKRRDLAKAEFAVWVCDDLSSPAKHPVTGDDVLGEFAS
jgi:hypothetical protein